MKHLGCTRRGLSSREAAGRHDRQGPNEIRDIKSRTDLEILRGQFESVPVALLGASGIAATLTRAFGDAAAIATVLAANGAIGYLTERRAEHTVAGLRKIAPRSATVIRDGKQRDVPAREIVVGDLLVLRPGEPVAADARVIEAHRLSANEAPLTGESLPVRKQASDRLQPDTPLAERSNMVHLGTVISGGTGTGVVTAIGDETALGSIRALVQEAEAPRTRLQGELDGLGQRLAFGASGLVAGVVAMGLLRGRPAGPVLRSAVALGVAAIPEGLPTVATSLLASGIRSLQKKSIYARRLDAVENLGAVDVVALDKTGTLTQNRMHVASVCTGTRYELLDSPDGGANRTLKPPSDWLAVCALCHEVEPDAGGWQGSPTETALVALSEQYGADPRSLMQKRPRIALKDRSEHHPYMVTLHTEPGGRWIQAVKGRPAEVLARCTRWRDGRRVMRLTPETRRKLLRLNDELAALGHRVLGLACKRQRSARLGKTGDLTWLGMVGLADPLRTGIRETIRRFRRAGIKPTMLTGDQLGTARAVAREIGLGEGILDAATLSEDAGKILDPAERASGFARSTPAMKLELVRALQKRGHVVAMTGDGINDGPALKAADVGVAMGVSGTDFAHSMSDLVLQGDHPDGLLEAIAEGRTAYLNVKKAVRYLVATNLSELSATAVCAALGLPDPFDPLALLWTNLITDVSPAIALGLEPAEPDILERPPFPATATLLDRADWTRVGLDGGLMTLTTLASYAYGLGRYGPGPRARTLAFMALTTSQLAYALTARSEGRITDPRLKPNPLLTRVTLASLALQAATTLPPLRGILRTAPLGLLDWGVVAATGAAPALVRELTKTPPPSRGRHA